MRLIDADAFKKYIIKGFEEMKSQFKTEFYLDIATRVTESFLEDIDEQPTVEAQPTDAVWRSDVEYIIKGSLCDLRRNEDKRIFINTLNSLPSVTPRTSLAETSQNCISILNRIMEYTYGMLTAEKYGLQHLIKSMMDELRGGDPE